MADIFQKNTGNLVQKSIKSIKKVLKSIKLVLFSTFIWFSFKVDLILLVLFCTKALKQY